MRKVRERISLLSSPVHTNRVISCINQTHILRNPSSHIMPRAVRGTRPERVLQQDVEVIVARRRHIANVDDTLPSKIDKTTKNVIAHCGLGTARAAEGRPAQQEDAVLGIRETVHDVGRSHVNRNGEPALAKDLIEGENREGFGSTLREYRMLLSAIIIIIFIAAVAAVFHFWKNVQDCFRKDVLDVSSSATHRDERARFRKRRLDDRRGHRLSRFLRTDQTPTKVRRRKAVTFKRQRDANGVRELGAELVDEVLVGDVVLGAGFAECGLDEVQGQRLVQRGGASGAGHVAVHFTDLDNARGVEHFVVTADAAAEVVL